MNILITNHSLGMAAGSEWVVIELAKELTRLGHRVAAASTHLGEAAGLMREIGIPVVCDAQEAPFTPDVIHGQHHLNAMEALCAWPETPAIYHCHGYVPWVETPPHHPRILCYAAMCDLLAEGLRISLGIAAKDVHVVPNWVDLERFHLQRDCPEKPRRALVFNRSLTTASWFANQIREGFAAHGIELHWEVPADMQKHPEMLLPNYDIVLAAGRSALEAMACGCSVLPVSASTSLALVDETNFHQLSAQNFSPLRTDPWVTSTQIADWLDRYHSPSALAVSARVRSEHALSKAVVTLTNLYHSTTTCWNSKSRHDAHSGEQELAALASYIRGLSPQIREYGSLLNLRHESAALDQALHAQHGEIRTLTGQIEDLHRQLHAVTAQRETAQQSLANTTHRNQELENTITQLKRRLRRHTREAGARSARGRLGWRPLAWTAAMLGRLIRLPLAPRSGR
jgi:hypothetical protein